MIAGSTFRPFAALCAVALLAPLARAQESPGSPGRFSLEGEDDLGRAVSATLTVTSSAGALTVERDGKVHTNEGTVLVRWRSSSVRQESPRVLHVTYRVPVPGAGGTIIAVLEGRDEASTAPGRENVLEARYSLSEDRKTLREVVLNDTRLAPEERWSSLETLGQRLRPPAPPAPKPPLPEPALMARVTRVMQHWHEGYTAATYSAIFATLTTERERSALYSLHLSDKVFSMACDITKVDEAWKSVVDARYETPDAYRDAQGAIVPRANVRVFSLSFAPVHAKRRLAKIFVFDDRTGVLLHQDELKAAPRRSSDRW